MKLKNLFNSNSMMTYNLIALGLIAVLSSSHHFLTNQLNKSGSGDTKRINVAGRQRMFSQRLAREVLLLAQSESPQEREQYRRSIADMMAVWNRAHEALQYGDRQAGLVPVGNSEIAVTFEKIDSHFHGLRKTLRTILAIPSSSREGFADSQSLRELIAHSNGFLKWMDIAVGQMEEVAAEKNADLKRTVLMTWTSVLIFLLLEALFLFLPFALRERKTNSELKRSVNQLHSDVALTKEALWRSEHFKTAMLANTSEGVVTMDDRGRVVEINQASERIFGFSMEEVVGKPVADLFIPEHLREQHNLGVEHYLKTGEGAYLGKQFEVPAIRKDGSEIPVEMIINVTEFKDHFFFTSFLRDITQRKQDEVERVRLFAAIEQVVESIVITDPEGIIQWVNSGFERNTGYTREEIYGQNSRILSSGNQEPEFYRELWETIADGSIWFGSFVNKKKDGTLFEEEASISPIFNDAGEIINYIAVKRDVTDERNKESQLRQAQKMEAIGVLSGGIAHDFNNVLTPILGYTEISKMALPKDSKVQNHLDVIFRAAMRAKELVAQILLFSRQTDGQRYPLGLEPLVKEVLKLLRSAIPRTIEIKFDFEPDLPLVSADATQIHSVLMNLCTNASHAMPDGGVLTVNLQRVLLADYEVRDGGKVSGEFVRLGVADNGQGMDEETLARVFDPFFTTKEVGKGTGLGLSTVYGIVQYHEGYISVESGPGRGTTFEIYLPASGTVPDHANESLHEPSHTGQETVLFIDDEEDIVSSIRLGLAQFGYKVTGFSNPVEALEHFRSHPGKYDVVITDLTMPLMTGEKVAGEVSRLAPDLPVILCSGNSKELTGDELEAMGIDCLVLKPYGPPDMGRAIRHVMDMAGRNSFPAHDHAGRFPGLLG